MLFVAERGSLQDNSHAAPPTAHLQRVQKERFEAADKNHDGKLDAEEHKSMFLLSQEEAGQGVVKALMEIHDKDANGVRVVPPNNSAIRLIYNNWFHSSDMIAHARLGHSDSTSYGARAFELFLNFCACYVASDLDLLGTS